jgi:hypothetical protein
MRLASLNQRIVVSHINGEGLCFLLNFPHCNIFFLKCYMELSFFLCTHKYTIATIYGCMLQRFPQCCKQVSLIWYALGKYFVYVTFFLCFVATKLVPYIIVVFLHGCVRNVTIFFWQLLRTTRKMLMRS